MAEVKQLKAEIRTDAFQLHEHTKEVIENELTDDDIRELLSMKWIPSPYDHLMQLPHTVVDSFAKQIETLANKYATTLVDVDKETQEASQALSAMIDELTGNEFDMAALHEFRKVLANG